MKCLVKRCQNSDELSEGHHLLLFKTIHVSGAMGRIYSINSTEPSFLCNDCFDGMNGECDNDQFSQVVRNVMDME